MAGDVEYDEEPRRARQLVPQKRDRLTLPDRRDRLQGHIETADNALDTLEARLGPVLVPERPEPALAGLAAQDNPEFSELSAFLDYITERAESLGRRISALSERVDL